MASDCPRALPLSCSALLLLLLLLQTRIASAIQVTPNSPCSSVCIDSSNLDISDPNSSNTNNSDMSCDDSDFTSSTAGQKWQSCLSCLQNSTFSQNSENDQDWFFYNLRYNFAYCIFGYPNASDVGSSPCQTSTACGPLQNAVEDGVPSMGNQSEYDYCSVDGDTMTGEFYSKCLSCVSAGGSTIVMANTLVALEAGCVQKSSHNVSVGLSGSIFSTSVISITEASSTTPASSGSRTSHLAATTLAAIVIASVVVVAVVGGVSFVIYRKRRRQRLGNSDLGHGGRSIKIDTFAEDQDNHDIIPSSAVSAGIGNLGWNTPPQSRTVSPYLGSVATMPGPEIYGQSMGSVTNDGSVNATHRSMPPSPLQVGVQFAVTDVKKDIYPPPYTGGKAPSDNRLTKLSVLPQITTALPTAAHLPSPSPVSAVSTIRGGEVRRSSHRRQHPSPMSTASSFTHTPFPHGHGSLNTSPSWIDSPVVATPTPTSSTALIPPMAFPATTMSPAAQLRQQQVRSALAPYVPASYGRFDGTGSAGGVGRPDQTSRARLSMASPGSGGLGIVDSALPASRLSTSGSTQLLPMTQPPSSSAPRNVNSTLSPNGGLGHLERLDMESVWRMNEASQKKAKKRASRMRNSQHDFSPVSPGGSGTGSPISTRSIQVQFPGPPTRK